MSAPAVPNAGWPPHVLVRRLERSGRGVLADKSFRGVVNVLHALADQIQDSRSSKSPSSCLVTTWQLEERTGYSDRWVRTCLKYLEEIGLITWHRGRWQNGKGKPSWITIQRQRLCALVREALRLGDERTRAHIAAIAEKIAKIGNPRFLQSGRKPQPEAATTPHPQGGLGPAPAGQAKREPRTGRGTHKAGRPPAEIIPWLPESCCHLTGDPLTCRHCRTAAYSDMKASIGMQGRVSSRPPVPESSPNPFAGLFDISQALGATP